MSKDSASGTPPSQRAASKTMAPENVQPLSAEQKYFESLLHVESDPDPWLALYWDSSYPMRRSAKAALLLSMRSRSRQFFLPIVRPIARVSIVLIQILKTFLPNALSASKFLHWTIAVGLRVFVRPDANRLVLRHFHIGSEILAFIAANVKNIQVPLSPLRPRTLDDLKDEVFLKHDLNLFNFIIRLNQAVERSGKPLEVSPVSELDFSAISDGEFDLAPLPNGAFNFVDVQTAIEVYTPLYQLFLTDNDFWRATNSLQLDETIGVYVAQILRNPVHLALINNKHPMVPMSTLRAGYRLMLHGLASEGLHALLVRYKRAQASGVLESVLQGGALLAPLT